MTPDEWKQFKRELFATFPTLKAWCQALPDEAKTAINARWTATIGGESLRDAQDALRRASLTAESPWPFPSDYERAGAILADMVRRSKPAPSDLDDRAMAGRRRGSAYNGDGTFSRFLRAVDEHQGHSAECRAFRVANGRCLPTCPVPGEVGRSFAVEALGLQEDRQRFDCTVCRDSGFVSCYRAKDVYWIAKLRRLPSSANPYSVRCNCRTGQSRNEDERYEDYDRELDVAINMTAAEVVTTCVAIYERIEERNKVRDSEGRVGIFDEFNDAGSVASVALS